MRVTRAVEDLSRQFGRPTLGAVRWFVEDENARVLSVHETEEDAERALSKVIILDIADDVWHDMSEPARREARHTFNRLPQADYDRYFTCAHFAAVKAGVLSI